MKENPPPTGRSVFARANALMQLRRSPSAERVVSAEPPVLTEALPDEDDLPLLTEIADASDPAENLATKPAMTEPPAIARISPSHFDQLSDELSRRVQQRLAAELPTLVEAALQSSLAGLTRELESGLSEITREAIQDFLAEHGKTPQ